MKNLWACDFCGRDALSDGTFTEFNGRTCFGHPECIDGLTYRPGLGVIALLSAMAGIVVVAFIIWSCA